MSWLLKIHDIPHLYCQWLYDVKRSSILGPGKIYGALPVVGIFTSVYCLLRN